MTRRISRANVALLVAMALAFTCGLRFSQPSGAMGASSAPPLVVNDNSDLPDAMPGDGVCDTRADPSMATCSLRAAVQEANQAQGPSTIEIDGRYILRTLRLGPEDQAVSGDLDVWHDLRIVGAGPDRTVLDAGGIGQIFRLHDGASLQLEHLTVVGGEARGPLASRDDGKAVLVDVVAADNRAAVAAKATSLRDQAARALLICGLGRSDEVLWMAHVEVSDSLGLAGLVGGVF